ncbi:hypothetical protein F5X97DRAFT_324540 [Nemania serpens]|nr:hypothetical protein F5X97DRAFT_324540 [Nemania serpens]
MSRRISMVILTLDVSFKGAALGNELEELVIQPIVRFNGENKSLISLQALIVVSPTVTSGGVYVTPRHFDHGLRHGDQS